MNRRVLAVITGLAALFVANTALAQSPLDFFRSQRQKPQQQQPQDRPAETRPPAKRATGAQPKPSTEATVPAAPKPATAAAPPQNLPPPPYEKDVRRIGEILGALHYLRPLCGADDGLVWRDKMRDLIEADGGPADRRERLAGAFNEGYNAFQLTYRTCTPSADLAVRRYLDEGAKLTRDIANRHGG